MARKSIDETGHKYGRLQVIKRFGSNNYGKTTWLCKCECGKEVVALGKKLRSGNTVSCGCISREKRTRFSRERLYAVWEGMKRRTQNPNAPRFKHYGGRGITICDEWSRSYLSFREWAYKHGYNADAPRGDCTIDRIDVNGNYCPENCRWVSISEQNKNKRPCKAAYAEDAK